MKASSPSLASSALTNKFVASSAHRAKWDSFLLRRPDLLRRGSICRFNVKDELPEATSETAASGSCSSSPRHGLHRFGAGPTGGAADRPRPTYRGRGGLPQATRAADNLPRHGRRLRRHPPRPPLLRHALGNGGAPASLLMSAMVLLSVVLPCRHPPILQGRPQRRASADWD
nr:uncharacterized protein LOC127335432 [Lolium perenne]